VSKKTILVDMDSIIADFYFRILEMYEEETGDKPRPDALDTWDARLPNGKDCFAYFSLPGFFKSLKPIPGAREFMQAAKAAGHDVLIVSTATLANAPAEKIEWLKEHMPWFDLKQVIFTGRKDAVKGDILIDDHRHNADLFRRANPDATIIGIEYPYNSGDLGSFSYLIKDYLNFEAAWKTISSLVL
jgi:5'-nucleotidase